MLRIACCPQLASIGGGERGREAMRAETDNRGPEEARLTTCFLVRHGVQNLDLIHACRAPSAPRAGIRVRVSLRHPSHMHPCAHPCMRACVLPPRCRQMKRSLRAPAANHTALHRDGSREKHKRERREKQKRERPSSVGPGLEMRANLPRTMAISLYVLPPSTGAPSTHERRTCVPPWCGA